MDQEAEAVAAPVPEVRDGASKALGHWQVEGETVASFLARLREWFARLPSTVVIATGPNV
jgi:hypothetical protein